MRIAVIASFLVDSLQRVVNIVLTILIVGALLLFGAHYVHVPALQRSWPVEVLHRNGDPIARHLALLLHLPGLTAYMPLVMAAIVYVLILMICYLNREDAIKAAQTILEQLLVFNHRDNALKTAFDVRCGINEGDVVVFEDSDLEKLVEHVIDVAGHMQKHAKPRTLRLSKDLYDVLQDTIGFRPTGEEVDGYQTYEWSPTKPLDASRAEPQTI